MKKLVSLFLILMLLVSLVGCGAAKTEESANTTDQNSKAVESSAKIYTPGTYNGTGTGKDGEIVVAVTFSETAIEKVEIVSNNETEGLSSPVFEKMPEMIVADQTLNLDTVTGATESSEGLLAAVADAVTQAGGDVEALKAVPKAEKSQEVETIQTDVVVVGAGASGTAAALAAAEKGVNVVLLEKAAGISSAGSMAGVLFADHSKLQVEAGKEVDSDWIYDQYITDSNYHANARLVSAIIGKSASTVEWLMNNGVHLTLLDAGQGSQYNHVGMPATAHGYVDGGMVALETLHEKIKSYGGQVLFETPGKELIFDENGKIAGVLAEKADGTQLQIYAKSVVLATGGFGGNADMMRAQFGEKAGTGLVRTATGDGIQMAWSAGAYKSGQDVAQWFGMTFDAEKSKNLKFKGELTDFVRNPLLFVNKNGQRFGSEEEAYESAALGTMIYSQPNAEMYIVFDEAMIKRVADKGLAEVFVDRWGHMYGQGIKFMEAGHVTEIDKITEAWRAPKDYTEVIEDAVSAGIVVKADSIEELAEKLEASYLTSEVENYNKMAVAGEDTQFYKNSKFMYPVTEGPYYAVVTKLRTLGTLGGVAINEEIQAIDGEGNPIDNLWVSGADAGGMYGNSYVMFEGATLGFAYNSGRIAGENAAANALK